MMYPRDAAHRPFYTSVFSRHRLKRLCTEFCCPAKGRHLIIRLTVSVTTCIVHLWFHFRSRQPGAPAYEPVPSPPTQQQDDLTGGFVRPLAVLLSLAVSLTAQTASVEGVVVNHVTGQPLSDVHVRVLTGDVATVSVERVYGAMSDSTGHFCAARDRSHATP